MIHYSCESGTEKSVLRMTDCHHSASLMMPIGDPQDGFFYPTLILMKDSYSLCVSELTPYFLSSASLYGI